MKSSVRRALLGYTLLGASAISACSNSTSTPTETTGIGGTAGMAGAVNAALGGKPNTGGTGGTAGASVHIGTAGAAGSTALARWAFGTSDAWSVKPADSFIPLRIDATTGTVFTPGAAIATLSVPFGASSNTGLQTTAIQRSITPAVNMTSLTLTLKIRWVSGGVGAVAGAEGGFDVYLIPSDVNWTEGTAGHGEFTLADRGAPTFKQMSYTIPPADATWDPTSIQQLQLRIDSKYWVGPTFDYTTAIFELDSISY